VAIEKAKNGKVDWNESELQPLMPQASAAEPEAEADEVAETAVLAAVVAVAAATAATPASSAALSKPWKRQERKQSQKDLKSEEKQSRLKWKWNADSLTNNLARIGENGPWCRGKIS